MKRGFIVALLLILPIAFSLTASAILISECSNESYLKEKADIIAIGTVSSVQDLLEHTDVRFEVIKYIKGENSEQIRLLVPGGKTIIIEDQPIFSDSSVGKKFKFYLKKGGQYDALICGANGVKDIKGECLVDSDCETTGIPAVLKCVNQHCVATISSKTESATYAGALPGSWEYRYKIWWEGVKGRFIIGDVNKQIYKLKLLDQRIAEINELTKKNLTEKSVEMVQDYEKELTKIEVNSEKLRALGKNVTLLQQHIANSTYKHIIVLQKVLAKVPESAKPSIEHAINVSQTGYENAFARLQEKEGSGVCNIGQVYISTPFKSEKCDCPAGYKLTVLSTTFGSCPGDSSIDCTSTRWQCLKETEQISTEGECDLDYDCATAGCSNEVCTTQAKAPTIITTCIYKEEYRCLQKTTCSCIQDKCKWVKSSASYKQCMELKNLTIEED